MYSVWRCVRAISNASSSAARYVLTVWFQLQPPTGFIRCEITTNIKHVLPATLLETSTFSGVSLNSLKTLLVLTHRRIIRLLGGSAVLPNSSLLPAMACVGLPDLIAASCNGSRAIGCSRPLRATTALLRTVFANVQERLTEPGTKGPVFPILLISPISTFSNCHFCDARVAHCRCQSYIFTLFLLPAT